MTRFRTYAASKVLAIALATRHVSLNSFDPQMDQPVMGFHFASKGMRVITLCASSNLVVSVCVMLKCIEAKGTIVTNCASDEYSINLFVCVPQVNSKVQSRRKLLCADVTLEFIIFLLVSDRGGIYVCGNRSCRVANGPSCDHGW